MNQNKFQQSNESRAIQIADELIARIEKEMLINSSNKRLVNELLDIRYGLNEIKQELK